MFYIPKHRRKRHIDTEAVAEAFKYIAGFIIMFTVMALAWWYGPYI